MSKQKISELLLNKTAKWIIAIIMIAVMGFILWTGIKIGSFLEGGAGEEKLEISQAVLQERLESIGELATMQYYYTDMGKYDSSKTIGDMKVPFTTTSFIITYDGIIKAGINLEEAEYIIDNKNITIKIPKSRVLSHEIIEDTTVVYDEKYSIFNGLNVTDVTNFQTEQKAVMEQKALDSGICQEADTKAAELIKSICSTLVENQRDKEEYKITVEIKE